MYIYIYKLNGDWGQDRVTIVINARYRLRPACML